MKVVFVLAIICAAPVALAQETKHKINFSTEGIYSVPFKRTSASIDAKGWTFTPGYTSSEHRKFGFVLTGYRFKRDLQHGELFTEPHVGVASGKDVGNTAIFGGRVELESHKWLVASWVDTFRGGKLNFTTCEPLAEISRHAFKNFFVGVTSSCYAGPTNETSEEPTKVTEGGATTSLTTKHLFFAGPNISFRHGRLVAGGSYEFGRDHSHVTAVYLNLRWR